MLKRTRTASALRLPLLAALLCLLLVVPTSSPGDPPPPEAPSTPGQSLKRGEATLWFKPAGPADAPTVLYLHGGPGYNAYAFEAAVGARLERRLRMVYLDQRGCGRSSPVEASDTGMEALIADIEALRQHLGVETLSLLGHSFGGLLLLAYAQRHPSRIHRLVLIESSPDLPRALTHQFEHLVEIAPKHFPKRVEDLRRLAERTELSALDKLMTAYGMLSRVGVQRRLHYATQASFERNEALDAASGLTGRGGQSLFMRLKQDGTLDASHDGLMRPPAAPTLVIAGRQSHVIGAELIQETAHALNAQLVWLESSGHFPYIEQPERFSEEILRFLAPR